MTKHFADDEKYIAVRGMDNAMELAKVLLKNGYEVFVELDDCDIYCVHYAYAKYKGFGNAAFYRISVDQADYLCASQYAEDENEDAIMDDDDYYDADCEDEDDYE